MDASNIIDYSNKLAAEFQKCGDNYERANALLAEAKEFLRIYAGPDSKFLSGLEVVESWSYSSESAEGAAEVLKAFAKFVDNGFVTGISIKRKVQIDVVSDFLEQALRLLDDKSVHAAVPAIIAGASLEEFLRTWVEAEDLSLGNRKPGINSFAMALHAKGVITKQDMKDITSWAGLRNHAAHGEWDKVANKEYVRLALEGINLFMRKYGSGNTR